jgi:hypothetical protein
MLRKLAALVSLALAVACGDSPAQPTATPTPTPIPVADLVVRLTTQVDGAGIRDAIAGFSEVSIDAAASTGPAPLTFAIDFGDGSKVTTATGKHVYANAGTFTVTVDVRDSQGRVGTRAQLVVVKQLTGSWFHAAYDPTTHRAEVRRLDIQSQDGPKIRGVYQRVGAVIEPFTATLSAPRRVQIVAGVTTLDGVVPNQLNTDAETWRFEVRGAGFNGEPFDFRAIIGEPTGPGPDASLKIVLGSFGWTVAIASLTDIDFDGSASRGDGLSYILEFGDGQFATTSRATHRADPPIAYMTSHKARMTVVDRFGRANTETAEYTVFMLPGVTSEKWYNPSPGPGLTFIFDRRSGLSYEGRISYTYPDGIQRNTTCKAVLSGDRDILITVDSLGLEFRGSIDMSTGSMTPSGAGWILPSVTLTQRGGPDDGRVWVLKYDDGPG